MEHARARGWWTEKKEEKKPVVKKQREREPAPVRKGESEDQAGWDFENAKSKRQVEEAAEDQQRAELGEEPEVQPGEHPLMTIEQKKTMWERRNEEIFDRVRNTRVARKVIHSQNKLEQSDSLGARAWTSVRDDINDRVDDVRDDFDSSQNPMVHKVRDMSDKVVGETETGIALAELGDDFHLPGFMDYLEDMMIPKVIGAYLQGDTKSTKMLQQWTAGEAARELYKLQVVRNKGLLGYADPRILEIRHVELTSAKLDKGVPTLMVSFQCQGVHCVRKLPGGRGDIIEGSPDNVVNTMYFWTLQKNEDRIEGEFEWVIIQFKSHVVARLVS